VSHCSSQNVNRNSRVGCKKIRHDKKRGNRAPLSPVGIKTEAAPECPKSKIRQHSSAGVSRGRQKKTLGGSRSSTKGSNGGVSRGCRNERPRGCKAMKNSKAATGNLYEKGQQTMMNTDFPKGLTRTESICVPLNQRGEKVSVGKWELGKLLGESDIFEERKCAGHQHFDPKLGRPALIDHNDQMLRG